MDKTTYKFSINSSTSTLNIGNSITTLNLNLGTNLSSGTINIGSSAKTTNISGNTTMLGTVNVSSGIINASYFTMYSSVIDSKPTTWLDTISSNLNTQLAIGFYNASEVFVGGPNTKSISIGRGNLGGTTTNINVGGNLNLYTPIKPQYPISFTSGQIGYTGYSIKSGSLVAGSYNGNVIYGLTGVYMVQSFSYIAAGSFSGVTSYDFQLGYDGVGQHTRIFLDSTNLNYNNNQQTISGLSFRRKYKFSWSSAL